MMARSRAKGRKEGRSLAADLNRPTLLKPRPWSAMLQLLHSHARRPSDWSRRTHRDNHPPLTTPSALHLQRVGHAGWLRGEAASFFVGF